MDGGPAFHRLSEELLTLIVDCFVPPHDTRADHRELLSLRLIHPKFAFLSRILSRGFREIKLIASPRGIERPLDPYLGNIAEYVKQVTFLPDAYTWLLGPKLFREIITTQAIHKFALENKVLGYLECQGGSGYPIDQWTEDPPITDAEFDAGYSRYRKRARQAEQLLRTGKVQSAWTEALKRLPRVTVFKLAMRDFARSPPRNHYDGDFITDCRISPWHLHDEQHSTRGCHDAASPIGDILTRTIGAVISSNATTATELIFKNVITNRFDWKHSREWDTLSFPSLRVLRWKPSFAADIHVSPFDSDSDDDDLFDEIAERNADALLVLLSRSADNLLKLDLGYGFRNVPMIWPPASVVVPGLMQVNEVRLTGAMRVGLLADWLWDLPALRDLTFCNCSMDTADNVGRSLIEVFDAIRDHPRIMAVTFSHVRLNSVRKIRKLHCDPKKEYDRVEGDEDDYNRSLTLYLAGQIEWNNILHQGI